MINFGLVDGPERAFAMGHEARAQDIDLLVIYVTTYALSSTILPILRRAKVPVLILNLQPTAALDYDAFNALPDRMATLEKAWGAAGHRRCAGLLMAGIQTMKLLQNTTC